MSPAVGFVLVMSVVCIALLAIPLTLSFDVERSNAWQHRILLRWGFQRLGATFRMDSDAPAVESRPAQAGSSSNPAFAAALFRQPRFRRWCGAVLQAARHRIHTSGLLLRVRLGLGDPADTGMLWSVLGPVSAGLACVDAATIQLGPEFVAQTLEIESRGAVTVTPLFLLGSCLALVMSPSLWLSVRAARLAVR